MVKSPAKVGRLSHPRLIRDLIDRSSKSYLRRRRRSHGGGSPRTQSSPNGGFASTTDVAICRSGIVQ
jgi:hypothetical protein